MTHTFNNKEGSIYEFKYVQEDGSFSILDIDASASETNQAIVNLLLGDETKIAEFASLMDVTPSSAYEDFAKANNIL